ncbi:hypothetical protein Anas_11176 [Armadillidium nasatum]|uniref:Uncharacterized protein n=1 Tax=Armadillidium nasatum TaxID=96803 RepID=A0A5N5SR28_9CRUS|nr:hypothetical protein Anas_11176 [Armadillidium nasatum]
MKFIKKSVVSCFALSLIVITLSIICINDNDNCIEELMKTPVEYIHEDILTYVQKHYMNPPQDGVVDPISADDIEHPKWRHISEWEEVTKLIKLIFKDVCIKIFKKDYI